MTTRQLIEAIHRSPLRCALVVTGGGTAAIAALLNVPGGSRTLIEAVVPYHEEALIEYLGRRPNSFCSEETSREMAERAWDRACWLTPGEEVVGVGCTASLVSDRPKRGTHRFHVSARWAGMTKTCSLTLTKGARDREEEEAVVDAMLLNLVAEAFGVASRIEPALLPGEQIEVEQTPAIDLPELLTRGEIHLFCVEHDGRMSRHAPAPRALMAGAFNPLHDGHQKLAAAAERKLALPVAFEMSVTNVDKGVLPVEEVCRRLQAFTWKAPLWVTRAPTFADKAELCPGVTFVVGADTATRIVDPRYYQNDETRMAESLSRIRERGCRFLVGGRADGKGQFVGLDRLEIPDAFSDLFEGISERDFHVDVSSTRLRAEANPPESPLRKQG